MRREDGTWDVRCPGALYQLRDKLRTLPNGKPRPYYWKVDRKTAALVVRILSRAYHIKPCRILPENPPQSAGPLNGMYDSAHNGKPAMWIHGRAHLKTVFHEWYHHLEAMKPEEYNSSDRHGGDSSYGWQFADRLWALLTEEPPPAPEKVKFIVLSDKRGAYLLHRGRRLRPAGMSKMYHPGTLVHATFSGNGPFVAMVTPWHARSNAATQAKPWTDDQTALKALSGLARAGANHKENRLETTAARHLMDMAAFIEKVKTGRLAGDPATEQLTLLVKRALAVGSPESERMAHRAEQLVRKARRGLLKLKRPKTVTAPKPTTTTKVKSKAPAAGWRALELTDGMRITVKMKCPYAGKRAERWVYRNGMKVADAVEAGASRADIKWDVAHGYVEVK